LLFALQCNATEFAASFSGFATYTAFSNQSFAESSGRVAANGSLHYGDAAIKTQIDNDPDKKIRRFALEYAWPWEKNNVVVQLGRLPRLNTLFSDVYGNPSEWGMAVLPLATYNRRKVHSLAFQAIEGVKVQYDKGLSFGNLRTTINYGTAIQERAHEWQTEAYRGVSFPGWDLDGDPHNSGDIALELTAGRWTAIASHNKVAVNTVLLDPADRRAVGLTSKILGLDYRFTRAGLKYATCDWSIQGEYGAGRNHLVTPAGEKLESKAWDAYILGGYDVLPKLTAYAGYATGQRYGSFLSIDRFAGATYRHGRWSYSAEYHHGNGSWGEYHGNDTVYRWEHLFVGAATVAF
jgi:hypothetical protein